MTDLIRRLFVLLGLPLKPYDAPHPATRGQATPPTLPAHCSPYGIVPAALLDAEAGVLVRPYLGAGSCWAHGVEAA
ncbi:hypothetical protein [Streptomyces sp. NPDC059909]|uniref:hypothetical protein n=1 Tax=Streptomyces sp. NPDC059909 TaxID=3346998 RepID=UPI00365A4218